MPAKVPGRSPAPPWERSIEILDRPACPNALTLLRGPYRTPDFTGLVVFQPLVDVCCGP